MDKPLIVCHADKVFSDDFRGVGRTTARARLFGKRIEAPA